MQGRDKMVRSFKFFHGLLDDEFTLYSNGNRRMTVAWNGETTIHAETELTRFLSDEISQSIDDDIVRTLTRTINGGGNDNLNYLNHYINMGGGNRA